MFKFSFAAFEYYDNGFNTLRNASRLYEGRYSLTSQKYTNNFIEFKGYHPLSEMKKSYNVELLEDKAMECNMEVLLYYTGESTDEIVIEGSWGDDFDESTWESIKKEANDIHAYGLQECNKYRIRTNGIRFSILNYMIDSMKANVIALVVQPRTIPATGYSYEDYVLNEEDEDGGEYI